MISTNNNYTKVLTMLENVVHVVSVEERLDSFELWTVALITHSPESAKNCLLQYLNTSKSILIFMPSTSDN